MSMKNPMHAAPQYGGCILFWYFGKFGMRMINPKHARPGHRQTVRLCHCASCREASPKANS